MNSIYDVDRCDVCQSSVLDVFYSDRPWGVKTVAWTCGSKECCDLVEALRDDNGVLRRAKVIVAARRWQRDRNMPVLPEVPDPCKGCGGSVAGGPVPPRGGDARVCGSCHDANVQACAGAPW